MVQMVLDCPQPAMLFWGPELVQVYNDAFVPSFGQGGKHPQAMGQRGPDCWAESWDLVGAQVQSALDGTAVQFTDVELPNHRNGRLEDVYWSYSYSPVQERGEVVGVLVLCQETTTRVLATRRLQLLQRLGHALAGAGDLDQVRAAVVGCLQGAALPELPAVCWPDLQIGPPALVEALRGVSADGEQPLPAPVGEVRRALRLPCDGGAVVFALAPRMPFDEAYRGFCDQLAEMVEAARSRLRAVDRQLQTERDLQELLLQAPFATSLLLGDDLRFELTNAAYVQMVGREVDGLPFYEAFPETAGTPVEAMIRRCYEQGEPVQVDEMLVPLLDDDGQLVDHWFRYNLQPLRRHGEVVGLMAMAMEITELVRSRDERTQLVAELEEASRAKDEFLAMLGHEMRNPLAPIVTALDLIERRGTDPFAREHDIMRRHARHLVRLVDDLLDVSRIARGKVTLQPGATDLCEVIDRAVDSVEPLMEERGHRLVVTAPSTLPLCADADRLTQVLTNLLTNAARYTPAGGTVEVGARQEGDAVRLWVRDDGVGMSDELQRSAFDMFTQGPQGPQRAQGGLGLGLAVTRALVELHGGRVSAHSDGPGAGSTFEVVLPCSTGASASEEPVATASSRVLGILVVDDNVDAAVLLAERLASEGHEVAVAHDGLAALERFEQVRPDVALLDLGLPGIDGYELARRLRRRSSCPLVAVTGYGQDADREAARQAGFSDLFAKPVDARALLAAIDRLVADR
jgi:signal transduction histidine kinase